ncbi:hypothetical protein BJX66DRAFT_313354 [Aspergillus keveii]|uniref:Uncharacterized protein n=1 Tax=Aspergillus keveii TaxID=714993 RepID=A0ABR4FSA5_9EURO
MTESPVPRGTRAFLPTGSLSIRFFSLSFVTCNVVISLSFVSALAYFSKDLFHHTSFFPRRAIYIYRFPGVYNLYNPPHLHPTMRPFSDYSTHTPASSSSSNNNNNANTSQSSSSSNKPVKQTK